jgi:hypothetical protein
MFACLVLACTLFSFEFVLVLFQVKCSHVMFSNSILIIFQVFKLDARRQASTNRQPRRRIHTMGRNQLFLRINHVGT